MPRLDRDLGKSGGGEDPAQVLAVAIGVWPRRVGRLRRRRTEVAHRDFKRQALVQALGDRRPHRHDQPPAGAQRREQVMEGGGGVGEKHHAEPRGQQVERRGRKLINLGVGEQQRNVLEATRRYPLARRIEHRL